jgi:hypothetical protein
MSGGRAPHILNINIRWRWEVSFIPKEREPCTHWIRGWMDPRAILDTMEQIQSLAPAGNQTSIPTAIQPIDHLLVSSFILLSLIHILTSGWQLMHQNPCETHLDYWGSSCGLPESVRFWICYLEWVYHSPHFSLACCVSSCHTKGYCTWTP